MSNLAGLYNAEKAKKAGDGNFEPLAAGVYKVIITDAELNPTARGGQRLALIMDVATEGFSGKKIWDGLNLVCPGSDVAENIAQKHLQEICEQIGVNPSDPSFSTGDLKMKPFDVAVKIEVQKDKSGNIEYLDDGVTPKKSNSVSSYKPSEGQGAQVSSAPTTQASEPADSPW